LNSNFLAPRASICCYLLEVAIFENYEQNWETFAKKHKKWPKNGKNRKN
jgi:hypothetical protein